MRRPTSSLVTIALVVLMSVLLAFIASTLALQRPRTGTLAASLKSGLSADYSADPHGIRLAPLSQELIEAARRDDRALEQRPNGVELVQIFRANDRPGPTGTTPPPSAPPGANPPPVPNPPAGTPVAGPFGPAPTAGPSATPTPPPPPGGTACPRPPP